MQQDTLLVNIIYILLSFAIHGWAIKAAHDKSPKSLLFISFLLGIHNGLILYRAIFVTKDFEKATKEDIEKAWNESKISDIEKALKCCGKEGPADYNKKAIPSSCYREGHENDQKYLYTDGCFHKYYDARVKFFGRRDLAVRWVEFALSFLCMTSTVAMVYFYFAEILPE